MVWGSSLDQWTVSASCLGSSMPSGPHSIVSLPKIELLFVDVEQSGLFDVCLFLFLRIVCPGQSPAGLD